MGKNSKLIVLRNNSNLTFAKTNETITVTNFASHYSKLRWKRRGTSTWDDVDASGKIENLVAGTYEFQWTSKNGGQYVGSTSTTYAITKIRKLLVKKSPNNKTTILLATMISTFSLVLIGILLKYLSKIKKKK